MKSSFSQKHPYWAAIFVGLLCTLFTALGSAIPQIIGLEEMPAIVVMTIAIAVSAGAGMFIMAKSRFSISEYGFSKHLGKNIRKVWFYIPLVIVELIPIIVCGFNNETALVFITVSLFTISVGFNEEIFFRGLALKIIGEKGIRTAIIWSSVIFGVLHIANALGGKNIFYIGLQIGFAFLVGFILAELVSITKTLWVAIIWHATHDFIAMTTQTQETSDTISLIILAAQTVILLIYAIGLWKKTR